MAPRRFALVCPDYHPRTCGVGDHSMRLGQELIRRGHQAAVFTRGSPAPHPEAPAIAVTGANGRSPTIIAHRLARDIAAYRPTDVLIQYTPHMLGSSRWGSPAMVHLVRALRPVRTVLLAHELFLPWRSRPDLLAGAVSTRAQIAALMASVDRTLVTMDMRVAQLVPVARLLRQPAPGVVRVGPNALPVPARQRPGRLRMGVFSTLASTKRFDVVLDCFAEVARTHDEAELVLLGDLADRSKPGLRELHEAIAAHPASSRIVMPGRLELAEIARRIADFDIYLFPMTSGVNTRSGTLPLALGAGLPVVAIKGYETDDLFVDGVNVMYAADLSGAAFARAALRVTADPGLRQRLSEGARRLYSEHLSWDKIGDQLLRQI